MQLRGGEGEVANLHRSLGMMQYYKTILYIILPKCKDRLTATTKRFSFLL